MKTEFFPFFFLPGFRIITWFFFFFDTLKWQPFLKVSLSSLGFLLFLCQFSAAILPNIALSDWKEAFDVAMCAWYNSKLYSFGPLHCFASLFLSGSQRFLSGFWAHHYMVVFLSYTLSTIAFFMEQSGKSKHQLTEPHGVKSLKKKKLLKWPSTCKTSVNSSAWWHRMQVCDHETHKEEGGP